jgi:hypothetical protein
MDYFSPIPNILVIRFTSTFKIDKGREFSQTLARYNMKEITEKSKYLDGYHY